MNRTLISRRLVAPLLALSLLGAGAVAVAGTAVAGEPAPREDAAVGTPAEAAAPAVESLTAHADVTTVRAWQQFRITGKTQGVKPGYTVLLQQKRSGEWKFLPAETTVNRDGSYSLRVKLGMKGKNELRIVTGERGTAISKTIQITVR
ncbi:hypothetical protein LHJ74_23095 [Streptomyces sp. N2-109]|uniref:Secreted protein n=1 Tax=Streptomyces gossypii TaxID=2883101 RepID=A0ABT2JXY5_9ACTN|nr:hypothetical protein [Streptomyces gossypii]MCT2592763.1 hypothetical protein [Streptomyces gossypii]